MSSPVSGIGPPDAKIAFIGEAPGADEEREGRPFVGASGRLLTEMCASVGIRREDCYIDNVVQIRPPGNDFRLFYTDARRTMPGEFLQRSRISLQDRLLQVKPNIIVALGNEPLRALTGKTGIDNWRGSLFDTRWGKVVGTYHPAYVLRVWDARVIVEHDLKRALQESGNRKLNLPEHKFKVWPSFEDIIAYLKGIDTGKRVAFDIETLGRRIRCVGLSTSVGEAICIPFMSKPGPRTGEKKLILVPDTYGMNSHWDVEHEAIILDELERVLGDENIPLVAQNFPFDATMLLREFGIVCRGLYMDTMVAQHCAYSELPKRLDFLASIYTRVPYWSDYDPQSDDETFVYNCYDASVTFEIAIALELELSE